MKIIIDAFGGDNAPFEIVKGAIMALEKHKDLEVVLTGDIVKIQQVLTEQNYQSERITILDAPDVISQDESPAQAIRSKTNSSLVVAFDALRKHADIDGLLSAGSTGAILIGSALRLGRISGISRPAMAITMPTLNGGKVILTDCGANADCKAINLYHFAVMADIYAKSQGIQSPRVALLNVGTENHKGNELSKETFELLENSDLNFVGNMEARDILSGKYDIVVADGFSGNIALKSIEGTAKFVIKSLRQEISSGFWSKIGALLLKKKLYNLKDKMDYTKYGGSLFLGVKKVVMKSHGNSKADTICLCIEQMMSIIENKVVQNISGVVN